MGHQATWTLSIRASSTALVLESESSRILVWLDWTSWWSACAANEVGEVEVERVAWGLGQGVGEKVVQGNKAHEHVRNRIWLAYAEMVERTLRCFSSGALDWFCAVLFRRRVCASNWCLSLMVEAWRELNCASFMSISLSCIALTDSWVFTFAATKLRRYLMVGGLMTSSASASFASLELRSVISEPFIWRRFGKEMRSSTGLEMVGGWLAGEKAEMRAGLFTSSEDMKLPKMFLSGLSKERMAAEGSRAVKESLDGLKISAPDSAALAEARRERCGRSRMGLTPRDEELEREGADIELVCVFVQITNEKITTDFL